MTEEETGRLMSLLEPTAVARAYLKHRGKSYTIFQLIDGLATSHPLALIPFYLYRKKAYLSEDGLQTLRINEQIIQRLSGAAQHVEETILKILSKEKISCPKASAPLALALGVLSVEKLTQWAKENESVDKRIATHLKDSDHWIGVLRETSDQDHLPLTALYRQLQKADEFSKYLRCSIADPKKWDELKLWMEAFCQTPSHRKLLLQLVKEHKEASTLLPIQAIWCLSAWKIADEKGFAAAFGSHLEYVASSLTAPVSD
jgi:hypothetical protein